MAEREGAPWRALETGGLAQIAAAPCRMAPVGTAQRRVSAVAGWVAAAAVIGGGTPGAWQAPDGDPFAFLAPWVRFSPAERERLDGGEVIAKPLPTSDRQAAVVVVARVRAVPDRLVVWTQAIDRFRRGRFVLAIGRFSDPPVPSDLDALTLDTEDVAAITQCRPGGCALKLTAAEMSAFAPLRSLPAAERHAAVHAAFRRLVLERLRVYRAGGLGALDAPADGEPRRIADAFSALVDRSPYLGRVPALVQWLRTWPPGPALDDAFFYWSKESYGSGKPVVSVTHVGIHRPPPGADRPAVVVAGKQLLATHYTNASLGLTMLLGGEGGRPAYLVYLNRTELDILGGFFGGLARSTMERRLGRQAPLVVQDLRRRLESGLPDPAVP